MKYLTKGELLMLLGDSSSKFTEFMMLPENFGLTGDSALAIKVAKQKLDWASTIDLEMLEVIDMMNLVVTLGITTQSTMDTIMSTEDRESGDLYIVNIIALSDIVLENQYGVIEKDGMFSVDVTFRNSRTNELQPEILVFTELPTTTTMSIAIETKLQELRRSI